MLDNLKRYRIIWLLAALMTAACSTLEEQPIGQLTVPQSPLLRTLERKSGLIAFLGVDGNIYTMNQAGKNLAQVTNDAELGDDFIRYYSQVTWAPDGKHIAYVSYSGSSMTEVEARLYVSQSSGEQVREIFASDHLIPVFLYWAPNSLMLSFLAMQAHGSHGILHVAHVDGGEARVMDTGQPLFWAWMPSATHILIHSNGARSNRPDARLAFISLEDQIVEEGLGRAPGLFQAPAISPDGSHLLLALETDEGESALMIVDNDGQNSKVIAISQQAIAFDWSPDGSHVGYLTYKDENHAAHGTLTFVELGTNENKTPMTIESNVVAFFWAPDGKRVAYFEIERNVDAHDSSEEDPIHLSLHVLDVDSRESDLLFSFTPSEQFVGLLPHIDQHQRTFTIWSPDSQYLAISAYTQAGPAIVIAQADGDFEPRVLQPGTLAVWSWQ